MAAAMSGINLPMKVVAGRMPHNPCAQMQPGQTLGEGSSGDREEGPVAAEESSTAATDVWDLAMAPLEGHRALIRGGEGALAMIAAGPGGSLMAVPEMYMQKIAVSAQAAGAVDMLASVSDNLKAVAGALGRKTRDLTVAVLDRPRHEELIEEIKRCGARLKLIEDGDISASLAAAVPETDIDMCIGIGGSTEGVITAAALRCLGAGMQVRFWPVSRHQVEKVKALGIEDVEALLNIEDMAGDGVMVAMTAVTTGRFLRGVETRSDGIRTETMLMCSHCNKISLVRTIHRQDPTTQPTPSLWML
jgi:fructose-1,6-bisphosphatase II